MEIKVENFNGNFEYDSSKNRIKYKLQNQKYNNQN